MKQKIFKTVKYSPITKSKASILVPWIDLSDKDLYKEYNSYNTGVNITANTKKVYSVCSGVILMVNKYRTNSSSVETYQVIVQYDAKQCVFYNGLDTVEVFPNKVVKPGDSIGTYKDYIHFEYATLTSPALSDATKGTYPRRVFGVTYYAEDPTKIVTGELDLDADSVISESYITPILHTDYGEG